MPPLSATAMTDEECYRELYKPKELKFTGDPSEVRLIILPPGKASDPLSITLEKRTLRRDFIALSYHWGDPKESRVKVPCNGLDIAITRNLHAALAHLRSPNAPMPVWADALCINQQDDEEKNAQVERMDEMYQHADAVLVWLGLPADDSDVVFDMAQNAGHGIEPLRSEDYSERQARAVAALERRHWFSRVWVVQEYALARRVFFQCGDRRVEGDSMRRVLERTPWNDLRRLDGTVEISVHHQHQQTPRCLLQARTGLSTGAYPYNLLELLCLFRNFDSTDPKDKVYALLNLARIGGCQPLVDIPVEYAKSVSVADLYVDVTFLIISITRTLDIISALLPRRRAPRGEVDPVSLPSWAVDWRRSDNGYHHIPVQHEWYIWDNVMQGSASDGRAQEYGFHATRLSIADPSPSSSRRMLCLSGYPFDDVVHLASVMPPEHAFQSYNHYLHVLGQWDDLAFAPTQPPNQHYPTGEDAATAFWNIAWFETQVPPGDWLPGKVAQYRKTLRQLRRNGGVAITRGCSLSSVPRIVTTASFVREDDIAGGICRLANYALARTRRGFLAAVPCDCMVGDTVALLAGGKVPLILRRRAGGWAVVGEAYVHGLMFGEAWNPRFCVPMVLV